MPKTHLISTAVVLGLCGAARSGTGYEVIDLGSLGGFRSGGLAVNNAGEAAGVSEIADSNFHAFEFAGGGLIDLGVLPGEEQSFGLTIDSAGVVAGVSYRLGQLNNRAFRAAPGGPPIELGAFTPRGGNDAGDLVGMIRVTSAAGWISQRPCLYHAGAISELSTLGGDTGRAFDINASGMVVGSSSLTGDHSTHAAMWIDGVVTDLGTLGGVESEAKAVNDGGLAAGHAATAGGAPHACTFMVQGGSPTVVRTDLGTLAGASTSYANGINAGGVVVGVSNSRAFIYRSGVMTDLNSLITPGSGWTLQTANAISDTGVIVGGGLFGGLPHGFMLVPVTCPGDFTGDQLVNVEDLNVVLGGFGARFDVNDLNIVLSHWSEACGS